MNKKDYIREKIIEIARAVFSKIGFRKTTMLDISKALYRAKSTLYHYFKSKEEILKAVVEKEALILKEKLEEALKSTDDSREKLKKYAKTRMKSFNYLANFYKAFKDDYLENYNFIQKIRKDYDNYELETIKNILEEGNKSGIFRVENTELTALAIITAMKGLEYPWAVSEKSSNIDRDIDILINVLFYGIVRR
ncbi:MAG: TetR/AcrR family transcriptional regulator [Candidatus Aminicenantia bacterium]